MSICLGAYETEADALAAIELRPERQADLEVIEDGDTEHPWRIWWNRA
jgi:hypothetical protein